MARSVCPNSSQEFAAYTPGAQVACRLIRKNLELRMLHGRRVAKLR